MTFHVITIFPKIFDSYFNESILKRAQKNRLINIKIHNLRDWATDKHKTVDDAPFGGGPGMIMKIEPLYMAIRAIKSQIPITKSQTNSKFKIQNSKLILLSAKGKKWNQQLAKKYSKLDNLVLVCGRYEGVDERIKKFIDQEISIGDYVLTGGEIGALAIVDSVTRLLPGALGNLESLKSESHSSPGVLEHPQYTRPEVFLATPFPKAFSPPPYEGGARGGLALLLKGGGGVKKYRVPKILLSGNHKKIEDWRNKHSRISPPRF